MEIEQAEESCEYGDATEEQHELETELTENLDQKQPSQQGAGRSSFVDGLAVGLGIGSIAAFAIVWISLFFSPLLPQSITYENLLATFIYPVIYLLAIGLVALTAGVIREYYSKTKL